MSIPTKPDVLDVSWATNDVTNGSNLTQNKKETTSLLKDFGWSFPQRPQRNILNWWMSAVWKWSNYLTKYFDLYLEQVFEGLAHDEQLTSGTTLYIKEGYISDQCAGLLYFPASSITITGSQYVYIQSLDTTYTVTTSDSSVTVSGIDAADIANITVGDVVSFNNEDTAYTVSSVGVSSIDLNTARPASGQGAGFQMRIRRLVASASFLSSTSDWTFCWICTAVESGGNITQVTDRRFPLFPKKARAALVTNGVDHESFVTPAMLAYWSGFVYATTSLFGKVRLATRADVLSRPTAIQTNPVVVTAESLSWNEMRPNRVLPLKYGTVYLAQPADTLDRVDGSKILSISSMGDTGSYATTSNAGFIIKASDIEAEQLSNNTKYITPAQLQYGRSVAVPAGSIFAYYGTSAPSGYLECRGQAVLITSGNYPGLLDIYCGDAYNATVDYGYRCTNSDGTGRSISGNYIVLPDFRGMFARGHKRDRTLGSYETSRGQQSYQADSYKTHTHDYTDRGAGGSNIEAGGSTGRPYSSDVLRTTDLSSGGSETYPRNVALMYIIKAH